MIKFNKDYKLKILFTVISIILLFTNPLYSFPFPKVTLRVPMDTDELSKRILKADNFLVDEDSKDDSLIKIFKTYYSQLEDGKHNIKIEKISAIPNGSREIERDGRVLWISPKAMKERQKIDSFVRNNKTDTEIVGFGLTKTYDDKTTVLVDFLAPRPDKIVMLELPLHLTQDYPGNFQRLRNIARDLLELLVESEQLSLVCIDNEICIESNKRDSPVSLEEMIAPLDIKEQRAQAWDLIYKFLDRISDGGLPKDIGALRGFLKGSKGLQLNTDWDVVVAPNFCLPTIVYATRLIFEAKQQKALPNYSMHYHPSESFIVLKSMKKVVQPSYGDIDHATKARVKWNEIQTLGTDEKPKSKTDITSQVYNMDELHSINPAIRDIIEELEGLDFGLIPDMLIQYVQNLSMYLEKLSGLNYDVGPVIVFALGEEKYESIYKHLGNARDVNSIKDMILRAITDPVDPDSKLKEISLDVLKMHFELNTHAIYQKIMKAVALDPNGEEKLNDLYPIIYQRIAKAVAYDSNVAEKLRDPFWWKPLLYNLSIATDEKEIRAGLQIAIEFINFLNALPITKDRAFLDQIKAVRQFL